MPDLEKLLQRAQARKGPESAPEDRTKAVAQANEIAARHEAALQEHDAAIAARIEAAKQGLPVDTAREEEAARKAAELKARLDEAHAAVRDQSRQRGANYTPSDPDSNRSQRRKRLQDTIAESTNGESLSSSENSMSPERMGRREAHVHVGAEHAADVIGVSGEIAEKLRTLENEVDEKIIRILEIINAGATVALDGESYSYDPDTDAISAPRKNPNLIESLEKKEKILRELAASVKDLPSVIEEILKLKDMTHTLLAPTLKKLEK